MGYGARLVLVGLYADNTLPLAVDRLCESLNSICRAVSFTSGGAPFRLTTPKIVSPTGDETLSSAILDETAEFDLTCLREDLDHCHVRTKREGLVRARPGLGTFVTRSPSGTDPATQARFLAELTGWLRSARSAGLDPDDIEAIYRTAFRTCFAEGAA